MSGFQLSRRQLLASGAGLAAIASGVGLAGCSGGGASNSKTKSAVAPPTYVAYDAGVKPDLPGDASGLPAVFYNYPSKPASRDGIPLPESDPVTALLQGIPQANPPGKNPWFQALEKDMGTKLTVNAVQSTDYVAKLQVTVAGEVPDLVQMVGLPSMPLVLDKLFTDLSEHLTGDAIKEYPGLASISTGAWETAMLNGRIWGIPQPRIPVGSVTSTRGDLLEKKGIKASPDLNDGQDFLEMCKELTDAKRGIYAMGALYTFIMQPFAEMMGAPNGWTEEGGKFSHMYETDEYAAALNEVAKFWKAGMMHPDSFSNPGSNLSWWSSGVTSLYVQSIAGWSGLALPNPSWNIGVLRLPKWQGGGKAKKALGLPAYGSYVSFKKADEKRAKELLRIADYLASPYGTEEFLTVNFGVEGADYKLDGTNAVNTDQSKADAPAGLSYMGTQLFSQLYVPGQDALVKEQYAFCKESLADGVKDASIGLYSETGATKGSAATAKLIDTLGSVVQGREPMSAWTTARAEWKKSAGDAWANDLAESKANQ